MDLRINLTDARTVPAPPGRGEAASAGARAAESRSAAGSDPLRGPPNLQSLALRALSVPPNTLAGLEVPWLTYAQVDPRAVAEFDPSIVAMWSSFNPSVAEAIELSPVPSPHSLSGALGACVSLAGSVADAALACPIPGETATSLANTALQRRFVRLLAIYEEAGRAELKDLPTSLPKLRLRDLLLRPDPDAVIPEYVGKYNAATCRVLRAQQALSNLEAEVRSAASHLHALPWGQPTDVAQRLGQTQEALSDNRQLTQVAPQTLFRDHEANIAELSRFNVRRHELLCRVVRETQQTA